MAGLERKKNFYRQFSIVKYSSLPRDTFKTYVERHVTRRKLSLKLIGYCRQSSYTDSEVVFTLLPAVAWVLKSQFAPGYMHFNKCFEGVSGKRGIFHNGKLAIEVFFLSRPAIDFSYWWRQEAIGYCSYNLLSKTLQSYHVDKVIMSVSRTDEERTKMRSQSSVILLQTMSFSANFTVKFSVCL